MKPQPISDRTWNGDQSWNREVIERVTLGGAVHKVRYRVRANAYDFQSYGKAEVWRDDRWSEVHRIPGQELKNTVSYVQREIPGNAFDADLAELRRVAEAVLT